jgi:Tol biopolymer transport system component
MRTPGEAYMKNGIRAWLAVFVLLNLLANAAFGCGTSSAEDDLTQLTSEEGAEYYADWSPDGKTIIYEVDHQQKPYSIWTMNVDGSGKTQLLSKAEAWLGAPVFSPDGSKIAFSHAGVIGVAEHDGTNIRLFDLSPGKKQDFPVWSPDGSRIAYSESISSPEVPIPSELWIADSDGSNKVMAIGDLEGNVKKSWSHDGARIVFASAGHLWLISPDGSGLFQLTNNTVNRDDYPGWSSDDKQILFQSEKKLPNGRDSSAIEVIGVDGKGREVLLDVYTRKGWDLIGEPRWSPDGKSIVFTVKTGSNEYDIWLMDLTSR